MTFSGPVNRHQADVIAYLVEENRVLKEQMKGRRTRLNDDQRRRLATKARLLGRRALNGVATIVTLDTLMRWHHRLIALKWTSSCPQARPRPSPARERTRRGGLGPAQGFREAQVGRP